MSLISKINPWQDELWNVSLLPTVASTSVIPPRGPAPNGGQRLESPALLSVRDQVGQEPLAEAA